MWFFSQTLYYLKRESEFNILQALGARVRDIRNIYVQGGLQMAGLSLIVSVALSFLGSYILFYVYNVIIPNFFTPQGARCGALHLLYALVRDTYFRSRIRGVRIPVRLPALQELLQEPLHS